MGGKKRRDESKLYINEHVQMVQVLNLGGIDFAGTPIANGHVVLGCDSLVHGVAARACWSICMYVRMCVIMCRNVCMCA